MKLLTRNSLSQSTLKNITITSVTVLSFLIASTTISSAAAEGISKSATKTTTSPETETSPSAEKDIAEILQSLTAPAEENEPSSSRQQAPETLGEITIFGQETLQDIMESIYGPHSYNEKNKSSILALNPHIEDPNVLQIGEKLQLPTLAVVLPSGSHDKLWVRLMTADNFQEAYRSLRIYEGRTPPLFIIPSWNTDGTFNFSILLEESFSERNEVENKLNLLSRDAFPEITVLSGLSREAFYFDEIPQLDSGTVMIAQASPTATSIQKVNHQKSTTDNAQPRASKQQVVQRVPSTEKTAQETSKPVAARKVTNPKELKNTKPAKLAKINRTKQKTASLLGTMTVAKGDTLGHMIRGAYGKNSVNRKNINWLVKNNRHIKNPNSVAPGTQVNFPVKAVLLPNGAAQGWWLKLGTFRSLQEAYTFLHQHTTGKHWLLIIPALSDKTPSFTIYVEQYYTEAKDAGMRLRELAGKGFTNISINKGLDRNKLFFKERTSK